jgi:hypothetical protein
MLFAVGAAAPRFDLLKLLTSTSRPTASFDAGEPASNSPTADKSSSPDSTASGFQYTLPSHGISADTMQALLAVQGQSQGPSSGSAATATGRFAASADDFQDENSDKMLSGSINVMNSDGTLTSTTVLIRVLDQTPTPLDLSGLRHLTGQEAS